MIYNTLAVQNNAFQVKKKHLPHSEIIFISLQLLKRKFRIIEKIVQQLYTIFC